MLRGLGVKTTVVVALIAVIVIAAALVAYLLLKPHASSVEVSAPYAFIVGENGQWFVEYYDESGNLHTLGPFSSLNDPSIVQAMSVVDQFNQQVVPQHPSYQPLDSIIVVGAGDTGKQGVVEIPVSGNTIELNQVNPRYYTLVAVPQQYTTQLMQALDTGYKLAATVSSQGLQYLQYNNPQVYNELKELIDLYKVYIPFGPSRLIVTNNNTLIAWGSLTSPFPNRGYGTNLPFIIQASGNFYNGS